MGDHQLSTYAAGTQRNRAATRTPKNGTATTPERKKHLQRTAQTIKHIADATRIQIVLMLTEGEQPVSAMCAAVGQSQPALSHHLALLRLGGIVETRRSGKTNIYSLTELGRTLSDLVNTID